MPKFSPVIFDRKTIWHTPLSEIYKLNQPSVIQMHFYVENKQVNLYIVDERGSLYCQRIPFFDSKSLINHFNLFFSSISKRRNLLLTENSLPAEEISSEFYLITKKRDKTFTTKFIDVKQLPDTNNFFNIQVLGNLDNNKQTTLTIYCQEHEFSTLEYGDSIFSAVAKHILEQRSNGQTYPIYITDLDLPRNMLFETHAGTLQTIHFLNYKKRIEKSLNDALHKLSMSGGV